MMMFSKRCQYAVLAVFELARQYQGGPVSATIISANQNIPKQFLQNILAQLRRGGFIHAYRGKQGGYALALAPEKLSVGQVVRLMEGEWKIVECLQSSDYPCKLKQRCVLEKMWRNIHESIEEILDGTNFAALADSGKADILEADLEPVVIAPKRQSTSQ